MVDKASMTGNRYLAEGIGTFALVFAGCGAIASNDTSGGLLGHVGVSLVFGLVVLAMIYSVGNISGAHINPAVTLGFFFAGRFRALSDPSRLRLLMRLEAGERSVGELTDFWRPTSEASVSGPSWRLS